MEIRKSNISLAAKMTLLICYGVAFFYSLLLPTKTQISGPYSDTLIIARKLFSAAGTALGILLLPFLVASVLYLLLGRRANVWSPIFVALFLFWLLAHFVGSQYK